MLFLSKKTTISWDFLRKKEKKKEKAFPWLATSQNLPGVQARRLLKTIIMTPWLKIVA